MFLPLVCSPVFTNKLAVHLCLRHHFDPFEPVQLCSSRQTMCTQGRIKQVYLCSIFLFLTQSLARFAPMFAHLPAAHREHCWFKANRIGQHERRGKGGEGLANLAIFTDAYLLMIGVRLLTIRFDGSHN